jgi:hypothetical protein
MGPKGVATKQWFSFLNCAKPQKQKVKEKYEVKI